MAAIKDVAKLFGLAFVCAFSLSNAHAEEPNYDNFDKYGNRLAPDQYVADGVLGPDVIGIVNAVFIDDEPLPRVLPYFCSARTKKHGDPADRKLKLYNLSASSDIRKVNYKLRNNTRVCQHIFPIRYGNVTIPVLFRLEADQSLLTEKSTQPYKITLIPQQPKFMKPPQQSDYPIQELPGHVALADTQFLFAASDLWPASGRTEDWAKPNWTDFGFTFKTSLSGLPVPIKIKSVVGAGWAMDTMYFTKLNKNKGMVVWNSIK